MIHFLSLFLITISSNATAPYIKMTCPEFDQSHALKLEPDKKYFNDSVRVRVDSKESTLKELEEFHQQFKSTQRPILLSNNESLAKKIGAPIVYSMTYHRAKYFGQKTHLTTHHVPAAVAFKTPQGYLAGDSRGEFGGELVFIDHEDNVNILQDINIEDIYKFGFGYVITAGLAHKQRNNGAIYLVTFNKNKPEISKLFNLLGAPKSSIKLPNGNLFINSQNGSELLKSDGSLYRIHCTSN
jgi:hypothetical protein